MISKQHCSNAEPTTITTTMMMQYNLVRMPTDYLLWIVRMCRLRAAESFISLPHFCHSSAQWRLSTRYIRSGAEQYRTLRLGSTSGQQENTNQTKHTISKCMEYGSICNSTCVILSNTTHTIHHSHSFSLCRATQRKHGLIVLGRPCALVSSSFPNKQLIINLCDNQQIICTSSDEYDHVIFDGTNKNLGGANKRPMAFGICMWIDLVGYFSGMENSIYISIPLVWLFIFLLLFLWAIDYSFNRLFVGARVSCPHNLTRRVGEMDRSEWELSASSICVCVRWR